MEDITWEDLVGDPLRLLSGTSTLEVVEARDTKTTFVEEVEAMVAASPRISRTEKLMVLVAEVLEARSIFK